MLCPISCIPCMPGAAGPLGKPASGSTILGAPAKPGASGAALCDRCIPPFPPEGRNMDCVPSATGNPVVGGEVGIRGGNWEEVDGPAALGARP